MSYILALDIGTSSVRAALYDLAGNVLPETMVKNERTLTVTDDGGAELTAEEGFAQICEAIEMVLEKTSEPIEYVAASCFWHSLLGIDTDGNPTTNVFAWAETRPAKYVEKLRTDLDETEVHNQTGARFHSSFWTAKLLWLKSEHKDVFEKTKQWISFSDYLALKLFGEAATSISMASGTGIFDQRKCEWAENLFDYFSISEENLPRIADDSETFQTDRWEQLKNAKWFLAIGDGAANNIGAGCVGETKAALMIGTSGAMRIAFAGNPPDQIPNGLWSYRIDRKRVIIGGALSDGGGLFRWLKDNLRLPKVDDETEDEIAKRKADGHGLTFLPFLAGERSTGYNESAHGAILGLRSATDSIDITQAALESVAYRFAEIFDQLKRVCPVETIVASGGALRESPIWTQIICDVLAQNMSLPDTREASSRGAVLLALETIGKIESIEKQETPKGQEFFFDQDRHEIYQKARKRHEKFYNLLIEK